METESARIQQMKEKTARSAFPQKSTEKLYEPLYWNGKFEYAENEIMQLIHNDSASRTLPIDVATWTSADVGIWIESLGLARYKSEFEHHQINGQKLLRLRSADIGIYVTEKKDIEFLHARLHKLKIKWRYRYVQLRKQRKKAKQEAKEQKMREKPETAQRQDLHDQLTAANYKLTEDEDAPSKLSKTIRTFTTRLRKFGSDERPQRQMSNRLSTFLTFHHAHNSSAHGIRPTHSPVTSVGVTNKFQLWKQGMTIRFSSFDEDADAKNEEKAQEEDVTPGNTKGAHPSDLQYAVDVGQINQYLNYFEQQDMMNEEGSHNNMVHKRDSQHTPADTHLTLRLALFCAVFDDDDVCKYMQ